MTLLSGPVVDRFGLITKPWARAFETEPTFTGIVPRLVPLLSADGLIDRTWRDYFRTKGDPPRNASPVTSGGFLTSPWAAFLSED